MAQLSPQHGRPFRSYPNNVCSQLITSSSKSNPNLNKSIQGRTVFYSCPTKPSEWTAHENSTEQMMKSIKREICKT